MEFNSFFFNINNWVNDVRYEQIIFTQLFYVTAQESQLLPAAWSQEDYGFPN